MPKRTDIQSILLIGSEPIVIRQPCEFDYSGTPACNTLKEEGYGVILINNSNPATIMTDPDMADRTYIEPLMVAASRNIIAWESPMPYYPLRETKRGQPIDRSRRCRHDGHSRRLETRDFNRPRTNYYDSTLKGFCSKILPPPQKS